MKAPGFSAGNFTLAWLAGGLVTWFAWAFLDDFYRSPWGPLLWCLPIYSIVTAGIQVLIPEVRRRYSLERHWPLSLLVPAAFLFSLAVMWLLMQFPALYDPAYLAVDAAGVPWFAGLAVFSGTWLAGASILLGRRPEPPVLLARFTGFVTSNLPGLLLSLAFFLAYASLALGYSIFLRDPARNFDDNFYDADPTSWMNRFAAPAGELIEMRPVHPLAFLIFRPLTWLAALPLNGDRFHAALLLNAGAGALCVLLAWMLVRRWSDAAFAGLAAAVLGVSASHLVLSTFLETYMFSAAALIGFLLLMATSQRPIKALVALGLLTFGITITNFVQAVVLFLSVEFKPMKLARYALGVLALGLVLAWIQSRLYPTSQPFYDPRRMLAENRYASNVARLDRLAERGYVLARTMTLYSVVGPRPLALTQEVGCEFPCFKTYKPRYGKDLITSYAGFGSWLARAWGAVLAVAFGIFAWRLYRSRTAQSLQLALLGCLIFNLILHLLYGDDPMLYSPDWTYALVFFAVLSLKPYAARPWFQAAGVALLAALMVNNWNFLRLMLLAVAPYL